MLQQTRVETVVPYYLRFIERFPDLRALAGASVDEVLASWSGLGYYRRARALHRAARILSEEHQGLFPDGVEGWLALPGVGRYTAGAIVSIALGKPAPILDGNVARVLARLFGVRGDPRSGAANRRLWKLAEEILPNREVSDFNQALMELGALVCLPRNPRCLVCPLQEHCAARRDGLEDELPELAARPRPVAVAMGAGLVQRRRKLLLYRRADAGLMQDLWEFPMAECRSNEEPREALAREARERYGIRLQPGEHLARVRHSIMNRRITLDAFATRIEGALPSEHGREHRWVGREEVSKLATSSLIRKILAKAPEL
jgi:A/G-specific adenine glycosylase